MSQSATLYRVAQIDFPIILDNPQDFDLFKMTKGYQTFQQTHEGLFFVLSKKKDEKTVKLVKQIFYPDKTIGETEDLKEINSVGFDFEKLEKQLNNLIYYQTPAVTTEISEFLDEISLAEFVSLFNYEELNREGIYPYNAWNSEEGQEYAFNVKHMTEEFLHLKEIFVEAKNNGDYMLSFVG